MAPDVTAFEKEKAVGNPRPGQEEKIVLTGIARSKGHVKSEAMVFSHRFGWAFNHVGNEDGKIYANPEALANAAVTGVFTPTARWDYWSQPKEKQLASEKDKPLHDGSCPLFS